jgi:APA family basic amino acid/polyamine antiporter
MALLVTDPGLTAMLAAGLTDNLNAIVRLSLVGQKAVGVAVILALAAVNVVGVRIGAAVIQGLAWLKLGLLALLVVWGFGRGLGDWSNFVPLVSRRAGADPWMPAFVGAYVMAFFSFAGWWDMSKVAGEVRDPGRTLPRALVLGTAAVTAVYLLVSAAFLYLVPPSQLAAGREVFAALAGRALFGTVGESVFSAIVVAAVLGSLASVIMASPRVYYAMARDGLFLPAIADLHPRFGTPARAIALQAVLATVLVLSGSFQEILSYFFLPTVTLLAFMIAAVYPLNRRSATKYERRVPGYPVTPLLFLVPIAVLLVLLAAGDRRGLYGLGVVLLGLPVYQVALARRGPSHKPPASEFMES